MHWSRTTFKIIVLAVLGFVIPVMALLLVDYAVSELGSRPDWNTVLDRYLAPAIGSSLLFFASAITSSTPRKVVTFVQSMFLHVVTFIVCGMAFLPLQHFKSSPPPGLSACIPFVAVLMVSAALLIVGNLPVAAKSNVSKPNGETTPD